MWSRLDICPLLPRIPPKRLTHEGIVSWSNGTIFHHPLRRQTDRIEGQVDGIHRRPQAPTHRRFRLRQNPRAVDKWNPRVSTQP